MLPRVLTVHAATAYMRILAPLMVFNIEKGSHHAVSIFICIGLILSLQNMPFAVYSLGNWILDACQKHAMNIQARKGNNHLGLQIYISSIHSTEKEKKKNTFIQENSPRNHNLSSGKC